MPKYVSEELTHFAGGGLPTDEDRYQLLTQTIIRTGTLLDRKYAGVPKTPITFLAVPKKDGTIDRDDFFPEPYFDVNVDAPMETNKFVDPEMVCFCDIPYEPLEQFRIHTAKYKRFGIAFKREFLIGQGASPVFYIASSSATPLRLVGDGGEFSHFFADSSIPSLITQSRNRCDFMGELRRRLIETIELARNTWEKQAETYQRGVTDAQALKQRLYETIDFPAGLFAYVFGYTKFFDPSLAEDDPGNFYMEREWRVLGRVHFKTSDIARLFVPPEFASRLRKDLPEYSGPIEQLP